MSAGIIDDFELIQIEIEKSMGIPLPGRIQGLVEQGFEPGPVDDPCQMVVKGQMADRRFGPLMGTAVVGLPQLTFDGGKQAGQIVFHHIVMGARLHGIHSYLFTNAAGNQNERGIGIVSLGQFQGSLGVEPRQIVVGDDQIPPPLLEGSLHRDCILYPVHLRNITTTPQLLQ